MSFSWTGRQLDSITKSDGTVVSFTYDANGMRTEKTVGDETYGYVWQNGKLIAETYVNGTDSREVYYIYDESGSPVAWSYLDEYYYYIKNQQGDILGFTDSEGNVVVTYEYDAWGNLLYYTGTLYLAEYNSLRYRGYAYDNETGLYYLQSRYYDPQVGRFLNADDTDYLGASGTVLGFNLYAYCENNMVNKADPSGNDAIILHSSKSVFKLGHIGLLFQYYGNWYYWYWGINFIIAPLQYAASFIANNGFNILNLPWSIYKTATQNVLAYAELIRVNNVFDKNTSASTINSRIKKAKGTVLEGFDGKIYIRGNFNSIYSYFNSLKKSLIYNLLGNNCMQTSLKGLQKGQFSSSNFANQAKLAVAICMIIPKLAYNYLYKNLR